MHVELLQWTAKAGWHMDAPATTASNLVIYYGERAALDKSGCYQHLKSLYPNAHIVGCSTGGEIFGAQVLDNSVSATAIRFDHTTLTTALTDANGAEDSFAAGVRLAEQLVRPELCYVLILSDGTNVNGSDLVRGLYSILPESVIITGGLAGDGAEFKHTTVGLDGDAKTRQIVAVGFYGERLRIGYGTAGGWKTFGPSWTITRSSGNILYELNGKPALDLYKIYLGEASQELPKNALLYPINMRSDVDSEHDIVRTIVGIDEQQKSLIFAGDIPQGYIARLMRSEFTQLIEGAASAATLAHNRMTEGNSSLALLVSCIGRKLVLAHSIHHETKAIAEVFGNAVPTIGFYSYGEICHQEFSGKCGLHNQTMTVTVLHEDA